MIEFNAKARDIQEVLKARGYVLGAGGPNRDGIDGLAGDRTFDAVLAELRKGEAARSAPPAPTLQPRAPDAALSPAQAMIDTALLKLAFPQNEAAELALWVEPTRAACVRWGIDTMREVASFLANISVESAGLTRMAESLNYSVDGLLKTFGRHRISEADARRLGRKPGEAGLPLDRQMLLANILYGGEFGRVNLGNTQPGDGWKFRGYGPKQLTGRDNHSRFAQAMGIAVDDVPALIRTREGGMMSAGWFWKSHNLDAKAATPGVEDDRRAINGGVNGLAEVEDRFDALIRELLRRERADQ